MGSGILEAETADKSIELLRFSETAFQKNDIGGISKAIGRLREQSGQDVGERKRNGEESHHEGARGHRCKEMPQRHTASERYMSSLPGRMRPSSSAV